MNASSTLVGIFFNGWHILANFMSTIWPTVWFTIGPLLDLLLFTMTIVQEFSNYSNIGKNRLVFADKNSQYFLPGGQIEISLLLSNSSICKSRGCQTLIAPPQKYCTCSYLSVCKSLRAGPSFSVNCVLILDMIFLLSALWFIFRPQSLAWEVRKMSPGKCISPPPAVLIAGRNSPIISAQKSLHFGSINQKAGTPNAGLSWADKVKGLKPSPTNSPGSQTNSGAGGCVSQETTSDQNSSSSNHASYDTINKSAEGSSENCSLVTVNDAGDGDDDNGWEIVGRGKHRSRGSSTSVSLKTSTSQDSVETLHLRIDQNSEHKNLSLINPDTVIATVGSAFERVDKSSPKSSGTDISKQTSVERIPEIKNERALVAKASSEESFAKKIGKEEGTEPKDAELIEEYSDVPKIDVSDLSRELNDSTLAEEKVLSMDLTDAENYDALILQAEIDGLIQSEEQQEEDMISRQIEEENEKALASAIEEEEHLTKELEDEALKNMDDEFTEDVSSDKEVNNTYEGQDTPRETSELDEPVSILHQAYRRYYHCHSFI